MFYVLNLTPDFDPYFNADDTYSISLASGSIWAGGEIKLQLRDDGLDSSWRVRITTRLNNSDDIMRLLMATDALREIGFDRISVFFPYVPYGRQDRVCFEGEPHSLRVFADLINAQNYENVVIFDPHSDVTAALIRRCVVLSTGVSAKFIRHAMHDAEDRLYFKRENIVLVSPDGGATKRVRKIENKLAAFRSGDSFTRNKVLYTDKERAPSGEIIGTKVISGPSDLTNCVALIADDICDGGRTFYALAQVLKNDLHASKVALAVSHGIFSYGFPESFEKNGIDLVYTTDSIRSDTPNVTTFKIKIKDIIDA